MVDVQNGIVMVTQFKKHRPLHFVALVFCFVFFSLQAHTSNKRILIMGDSWAEGMTVFGAVQHVLDRYGFSHIEATGARTAIGGTKAERWAKNWKGHLDILRDELEKNPSIDIVFMTLGGNDFLSLAMRENLAELSPEQRMASWKQICSDLKAVIDFIKSIRPNIRILLCDYDYLEPERMTATYQLQFHGITPEQINTALVELAKEKRKLMAAYPDCGYVQNFGLLQYTYGNGDVIKPGAVCPPGKAPDYEPFPGGDIRYPSGTEAMPDGVHPVPRAYITIVENCFSQFLYTWLLETERREGAATR